MLVLAVVREEERPRCFFEMQTHTPQWRRSRRARSYLHSRRANRGSRWWSALAKLTHGNGPSKGWTTVELHALDVTIVVVCFFVVVNLSARGPMGCCVVGAS